MRKYFVLVLMVLGVSHVSLARWAQLDDAPVVVKSQTQVVHINKDGTYELTREYLAEVRNEEGRVSAGSGAISYNARTTKVSNLKAQTRNADATIDVKKEFIEDKPAASSPEGFDETRKIAIAYPKVEIGSQLYLRYSEQVHEVPFSGFFATEIEFGTEYFEEKSEVTIESEIPLFLEVNDPEKRLAIEFDKEKPFTLKLKLIKPTYTKVIDEDGPYLSSKVKTWVVVSTSKDYGHFAKVVTPDYEAVLSSDLPSSYQRILEAAKKKTTVVDRVNIITSLLADEVRYLGDWRPRRGGHIPRPFETVAATRFGDCKDYSSALAAILRKLGYDAKVAWVERGPQPSPLPSIALDTAFNHAIVYLKVDQQTHWFDPTNFASFAQGIFSDIAGRPALVVDGDKSRLETIPEGKSSQASRRSELEINPDKGGDAVLTAKAEFIGRSATFITGMSRAFSRARIDHFLSKAVAEDNYVIWKKVEPYDLTSRITKDVTFKLAVGVKNILAKTTAGRAYFLPRGELGKWIDLEPHNRESDLSLGEPETVTMSYRLKNAKLVGAIPIGCQITSPWLDLKRTVVKEGKDIVVHDTRELKTYALPNTEIKSKRFSDFQNKIQACFHQVAIVFR